MKAASEVELILGNIFTTGQTVEHFLRNYNQKALFDNHSLTEIIEYALSDIGLRLRPYLLRIIYESGGGNFEEILPIAAGLELLNLSTLVIDDILDDSPLRNKQPSVIAKWGTKYAVTAGIIMSSTGFVLFSNSLKKLINCKNMMDIMSLVAQAYEDIYFGQFEDLDNEGIFTFNEKKYFEMISKTTASFIRAPLVIGAMLWNAPKQYIKILEEIGQNLGLAYQLRDDVIDIIGDPEFTGKPKAGDLRQRKMRLPIIHLMKHSSQSESDRLINLLHSNRPLIQSESDEIVNLLKRNGSIEYVIRKTKEYCQYAIALLERFPSKSEPLTSNLRVIAGLVSSFANNHN